MIHPKQQPARVILLIAIIVQVHTFPADLTPTPSQSQETLPVRRRFLARTAQAGPPSVRPPSLTTEKTPTSTEPAAEASGPVGGKLPEFPGLSGGSGSGGAQQAVRPMLVLGAFQAIITPFDPSMLGSLVGGLGGGGGAGLPTFPPGQGSG
ncbi:hypothetical protein quinque_002821 [Culex quinquefasciatus]